MADTAKVIILKGDKRAKAESAEHIIEFPGGAISVQRTRNNEYWAHIIVYHGQPIPDAEGRVSANAVAIDGRIDYLNPPMDIRDIPDLEKLEQIAVRIKVIP